MPEKIEIMDALRILAAIEKKNHEFYKEFEADTGLCVAKTNQGGECLVFGLSKSACELTKTKRDSEKFPTQYSIVVGGIMFFEITDEAWEGKE